MAGLPVSGTRYGMPSPRRTNKPARSPKRAPRKQSTWKRRLGDGAPEAKGDEQIAGSPQSNSPAAEAAAYISDASSSADVRSTGHGDTSTRSGSSEDAPRHRVRALRTALHAFRLFQPRPATDRWAALCILRGAIVSARPERVQLCLIAMRLCLADNGAASKGSYEQWRSEQPRPDEWPSSQAISDTFGSWRRAKDAAGAIAFADVLESELSGSEVAYTPEELVACVKAFADTGRPLMWKEYHAFAVDQMSRPDRELPRFFRERALVHRHFRTWTRLLIAAGLGARMAAEYRHRGATAGARDDYSEQACIRWIATAAERFGPGVTTRQYERFALDCEREARERGEHLVVPRREVIKRVLGLWPVALHKAGVISAEEMRLRRSRGTTTRTDEDLIADIAESMVMLGADLARGEHDLYRLKLVREGGRVLATGGRIATRLGSWSHARALALEHLAGLGVTRDQLPDRHDVRRKALLQSVMAASNGGVA